MAEEKKASAEVKKETAMEQEPVGKILFTEEQIRARARELGRQIREDLKDQDELIVVCTLKGAVMWMTDLVKEIPMDTKLDFVIASSYGSSTASSGVVTIKMDVESNLYKKNVLVVEDIVDSGNTLSFLMEKLKERNPRWLKVCTMLDKPSRRTTGFKADYVGFTVDDLFIIGYGLDYDQRYRGLPYISYLQSEN
ncbi:hypoxanthine phosphoribosyltransferase [Mobilibacterium timonense]|uniref:hypoxanthine phosphoribosyltransferase n=1 Tax=Mobilibacterium timonense TaxID=1871012 RepID=UPI001F289656|nr:hypoxanthine phosphoribosyltransferase [Mobilibacterium timonense]